MIRRTNPRKANGHAGPAGRPNGHDPASVERGGVPVAVCPADSHPDHAASDDASGSPVACASALAVAGLLLQASTDREACAAAAPPPTQSTKRAPETERPQGTGADLEEFPGGESPLPATPSDFVEEIHRRADLFEAWQSLLNSKDEKIRQRAVEKLTEMRYKGAAALADEPPRIVIDMPRPDRD